MNLSSALIVFGGLPGTGKTTIARELTVRLERAEIYVCDKIGQLAGPSP